MAGGDTPRCAAYLGGRALAAPAMRRNTAGWRHEWAAKRQRKRNSCDEREATPGQTRSTPTFSGKEWSET